MGQRDIGQLEQSSWKAYYKVLFKEGRESATGLPANSISQSAMDVSDEDRERHLEEIWARGGFNFQVANYHDIVRNEDSNRKVYDFWAKKVRQRIKDPRKRALMAPTDPPYFFGTKRVPLEQDYYECVDQGNVDLVDLTKTPIKEFNETGILLDSTENRQLDLDIVVLATGFDAVTGS
jgi:cation diffusion facilitator CzcD-associated flavoprotein CzcO